MARPAARTGCARREERLAWALVTPSLLIILVMALVPVVWALWESLHVHDLRMPWLGRPFVGLANYAEAIAQARFWQAVGHTALFVFISVSLELALGLALALVLHRAGRGRGFLRTVALLPWAMPTVVVALLWRFIFEAPYGIANRLLLRASVLEEPLVWLGGAVAAWVPVILADVWKTAPFVALLLLAGLQTIDPSLYEAASIDGAGVWKRFMHVTLPLLKPALLVALIFRTLDALRVFDLIYVLTGGGPGTATEPLALYTFQSLLRNLRFGFGSALSLIVFVLSIALALIYIRLLGRGFLGGEK
jgi:ABC-type sugar transport system permease subunit